MKQIVRRKLLFRVRRHTLPLLLSRWRVAYWRLLGMRIGKNVRVCPLRVTWPHRIRLGDDCSLEHSVYFNLAGGYRSDGGVTIGRGTFVGSGCEFNVTSAVEIGEECLIASGCRFIDHDHGTGTDEIMKGQAEVEAPIRIGSDVWIGANCVVLKGVAIGNGTVVAAGSVVTKPLESMAVYAGVPARLVRRRTLHDVNATKRAKEICLVA